MFGRKRKQTADGVGAVDGGEGRGVPLGGRDQRPPTGYDSSRDDDWEFSNPVDDDREFFGLDDDDEGPDRRRDPLRR